MDPQVFADLSSSDETLRNNATAALIEAMEDPNFLNFLLQLLDVIKTERNHIITLNLLYVIYKMLDKHRYSFDSIQQLVQHLFNLILEIDYQAIESLLRCFTRIYTNYPNIFAPYLEITINTIITHETIEKTALALCFTNKFLPRVFQKQDSVVILNDVAARLIPKLFEIMNLIITTAAGANLSDLSIDIIDNIYQIFGFLIKTDFVINSEETIHLIQLIPQLLTSNDYRLKMNELRKSLLKGQDGIVSILMSKYGNPEFVRPQAQQFSSFIFTEFSAIIIDSLLQVYSSASDNYDLITSIIPAFTLMISKGIHLEVLISENFITTFVFPVCRLLQDDYALMEQNPLQYYYFCVKINHNTGRDIVRGCIYFLLKEMHIHQPDIVHYFIDHFSDNVVDNAGLESRLFILSILSLFEKFDEGVITPLLSIDFSEDLSVRLQFLGLLGNIMKHGSIGTIETTVYLIELSCNAIFNDPIPLGKFASCILFLKSYDENSYNVAENYNIIEMIQIIISIMEEFNDKKIQHIISILAVSHPESLQSDAFSLISTLLELWEGNASTLDESSDYSSNASEILVTVASIIDSMPMDLFKDESDQIIEFVFKCLVQYNVADCEKQLCAILISLKKKLSVPQISFYNVFDAFVQIIENNETKVDLIENCLDLIMCLINDFQNFVASEKISVLLSLIDHTMQQTDLEMYTSAISICLANVIQHLQKSESALELTQKSFAFINDDSQMPLFESAIIHLASGILINEIEICSNIPDEIIGFILNRVKKLSKSSCQRVRKYSIICMTSFAQSRNAPELANAAAFLMNSLLGEDSDDSEYSDYSDIDLLDSDESKGDMSGYKAPSNKLPYDDFDVHSYFKSKMIESRLINALDPRYQNLFTEQAPTQ